MTRPDPRGFRLAALSRVLPVFSAVALAAVLYYTVDVATSSYDLFKIWKGDFRGDGRQPRAVPVADSLRVLDAAGKPAVIPLAGHTTVILVYDAKCGVCASNTPRWLDLVMEMRRLHPNVPIYAMPLRPDTVPENRTYWAGLEHKVMRANAVDLAQLKKVVGVSVTPATIVIRNGVRVATQVGIVGERRRAFLLEQLALGDAR